MLDLTVDEILATLSRSNINNVVIEGRDDIVVFRSVENLPGLGLTSIIAAGGRTKVLEVFRRKAELPTGCRVVFVADKDTWVLGKMPKCYQDPSLIFTDGYSIENDVIRDGRVISFMTTQENVAYKAELTTFCEWYAIVTRRHMFSKSETISLNPSTVIMDNALRSNAVTLKSGEKFPCSIHAQISTNSEKLIRGKSLMKLIMRQIGVPGRVPRHNGLALMESIANNPGALLGSMFSTIRDELASQETGGK